MAELTDRENSKKNFELGTFFRKYGMLLVLILIVVLLLSTNETFRTLQNIINVLQQISINGIIAVGMTFVIVGGGIDLSVGSVIALTSVTIGFFLDKNPAYVVLAIIVALIACSLAGLFNGFFVAKFNIFPFVVTLASLMIIRGIAYIISQGKSFVLMSDSFKQIGQGKVFGRIPIGVIIFIVVAFLGYMLLSFTKFGRYVYAVGGNVIAATAASINVFAIKLLTYVLMGFCVGIAGIILSSRVNAGQPSIGTGYELDAIAAVIIGGTSFFGGIGTIQGTVIGALIIGVISNGMNLFGISSYYQQIVRGFIILVAVLADSFVSRRKR